GSSLYLVLKGELEVDVDGNQVGSIHQDSFFGEMSLLTGEPRQATVRSVCEVWLAEITREMLEPLLRANPELLEKISTVLATRRERSEQLARNSGGIQGRTGVRDDYLQRLRNFFRL
ncbi:MAG TPA: cyclic nucleotide-binding domain-containing protein, partial [Deltaproteobacteria bacterium]|nr:cyclic nucleotide-binding domain-containing protein [Deltaproteobacteria bacterium]